MCLRNLGLHDRKRHRAKWLFVDLHDSYPKNLRRMTQTLVYITSACRMDRSSNVHKPSASRASPLGLPALAAPTRVQGGGRISSKPRAIRSPRMRQNAPGASCSSQDGVRAQRRYGGLHRVQRPGAGRNGAAACDSFTAHATECGLRRVRRN